jgi:hypothetical protein
MPSRANMLKIYNYNYSVRFEELSVSMKLINYIISILMKKLKLITPLIAIFMFSNLLVAINPNKKDYTKNLADNMMKGLCKDVNITDSQKIIIQTKAKEYEVKLQSLSQQSNVTSKNAINVQAVQDYRSMLAGILTKDQIDSLKTKRIERLKLASNKNNTKNL